MKFLKMYEIVSLVFGMIVRLVGIIICSAGLWSVAPGLPFEGLIGVIVFSTLVAMHLYMSAADNVIALIHFDAYMRAQLLESAYLQYKGEAQ